MSTLKHNANSDNPPGQKLRLPFALPVIEGKKMKKKCCKKFKKGKRCGRCPNN
jgi:hypothetical protein